MLYSACRLLSSKGLVISTGVIGNMLPMKKVRAGIADASRQLAATKEGFLSAARGIMTTDTVEKYVTKQLTLPSQNTVTIAGICKGAAMIGPKMATLLAVVMTDAALEPEMAQQILRQAADVSFNCVTVEGHTSTSDTLLLLANGAASPEPLAGADFEAFSIALRELCIELAIKVPADGEGATHLITVDVEGCQDEAAVRAIARKVSEDALVKTAICGADPNWGRIVSASGTAGVPYDPGKMSLKLNGFELFRNGEPLSFDKETVANSIRASRDTHILLRFGEGDASIRFWTTDLTAEYVRLNSDYTT